MVGRNCEKIQSSGLWMLVCEGLYEYENEFGEVVFFRDEVIVRTGCARMSEAD